MEAVASSITLARISLDLGIQRHLEFTKNFVPLQNRPCHTDKLLFALRIVFAAFANNVVEIFEHVLVPAFFLVDRAQVPAIRLLVVNRQKMHSAKGLVDFVVAILVKDVESRP
jgi:hypothetical protein